MRLVGFIFLCLTCYFLSASADELEQIYQAEVNVSSRGVDDRNIAIRDAMKIVLSRIVLETDFNSQPAFTALLNSASRLAQTYRYSTRSKIDNIDNDTVILRLRVDFDGNSIRRILQASGIAVWGANRPSILVWLAVEQNGVRGLFQPEQMVALNQSLWKTASDKGLSLVLPLLDLIDQDSLSAGDLWAGFNERVIQASSRYDANIILTGRLVQINGSDWDARWQLYSADDIVSWGRDGDQGLDGILKNGLHGTYERLFPIYATRDVLEVKDGIHLRVVGLSKLNDFARVAQYLATLSPTGKVIWLKLEPTAVTFRLHLKSNSDALKQALATSDVLGNDVLAEQQSGLLQYHFKP